MLDAELGCFWHGHEPIPDDAYVVCGECGHCWVTGDDLLADARLLCAEIGLTLPPGDPDKITFCPLCSHDL
jgi:hypothetical protein